MNDFVHANSKALVNISLVRVRCDSRDLERNDRNQRLTHCFSLNVVLLDALLILLLETNDVLGSSATIHDWHVNVHENEPEPNTTVASKLGVSVSNKLLDSLCSVKSLHYIDSKLVLQQHGKGHQVERIVINTQDGGLTLT